MKLNRAETAQKLNVALTTVDDWRRKGCPHTKEGKQVYFDIDELNKWLNQRSSSGLDYTQERAKLTRLQAQKIALKLAHQRAELIPVEMAVVAWQGLIANARAKLLALPPKASALVNEMDGYRDIEYTLNKLIYDTLDELSSEGIPKEYQEKLKVLSVINRL